MVGEPVPPEVDSGARLVIITGAGRSGTSTVAGTLKMLGGHIPQPELPPNDANPRGPFEPRWPVEFNMRVLDDAGVRHLDSRPAALDLMADATSNSEYRAELSAWLATQLNEPMIVVKDPRMFWLRDLWVDVAADLGVSTGFLTMLRHPAEVVGSRSMHYHKKAGPDALRVRETVNLAGWVNVMLTNERSSRGGDRVFVHYLDLIRDWRATMTEAGAKLGLTYNADLTGREAHEVDDFIDVGLRRSRVTWDDLDVPERLREIADIVQHHLDLLSKDPQDAAAMEGNDEMRVAYDEQYQQASAIVRHHISSTVAEARAQERREVTRELKKKWATQSSPSLPRRVVRRVRAMRARRARRSRGD